MISTKICKSTVLATAVLALGGIAASARAATDTTTFDVTIEITNVCDVQTAAATDMDFSANSSSATNIAATSIITLTCTPGATYDVGLDGGTTTGNVAAREMDATTGGNTDTVGYQLYQELAHTNVWGNTIGTDTVGGIGTGAAQALTVYGLVASANVTADTYLDTVTVTVTY